MSSVSYSRIDGTLNHLASGLELRGRLGRC
jgi:hypothetical protein